MSHETASHITGLFYNFTFVKMKRSNKINFETETELCESEPVSDRILVSHSSM